MNLFRSRVDVFEAINRCEWQKVKDAVVPGKVRHEETWRYADFCTAVCCCLSEIVWYITATVVYRCWCGVFERKGDFTSNGPPSAFILEQACCHNLKIPKTSSAVVLLFFENRFVFFVNFVFARWLCKNILHAAKNWGKRRCDGPKQQRDKQPANHNTSHESQVVGEHGCTL